jgi:glycosyltransferase involved in cell wall biosynthesis
LHRHATYFTTVNRLVAEQGAHEINHLTGCAKFFPFWLASHIRPAEDTFFLDANIRPEFSNDISDWISWRSTVTFFNLQLAYGLGYKKVLMIGFDHFYRQPAGVKEADLIDQKQQDENHFLPNYFMGKKWQAADVGNMEKMYLLAQSTYESAGREIVNCTVGGHLEVFRRGNLKKELGIGRYQSNRSSENSTNPSRVEIEATPDYPRLLMIDSTPFGSLSATGQLKKIFLGDWPADRFLQIWENHSNKPTLHAIRRNESLESSRSKSFNLDEVVALSREFRPDAVYFRPVDYPLLMQAAERVIAETRAPFALHIMDDWQERMRESNPDMYRVLDAPLRNLINHASVRWSICDAMSEEYLSRYGHSFEALANGVDLADFSLQWESSLRTEVGVFKLRYLGGLAKDMTFQSVMDIANAVSELQAEVPIQFDIHTMDIYREEAQRAIASLRGVRIQSAVSGEPYYNLLAESDALVVAYNFDPQSIRYTRLSIANKMPECMASGAALLAYGPPEVATIGYLQRVGCAKIVSRRDRFYLKNALKELATDTAQTGALVSKARNFVARHLSKKNVQDRFRVGIVKTASSAHPSIKSVLKLAKSSSTSPKPESKADTPPNESKYLLKADEVFIHKGNNSWQFVDNGSGNQKLWMAVLEEPREVKDREFFGALVVASSEGMGIQFSLNRHGDKAFDGPSKNYIMMPGVPELLMVKHRFQGNHPKIRLQLEVLKCQSGKSDLEVSNIRLFETPESIASALHSFHHANSLMRAGSYEDCIPVYYALAKMHQHDMYIQNADFALQKLGFKNEAIRKKIAEELMQVVA